MIDSESKFTFSLHHTPLINIFQNLLNYILPPLSNWIARIYIDHVVTGKKRTTKLLLNLWIHLCLCSQPPRKPKCIISLIFSNVFPELRKFFEIFSLTRSCSLERALWDVLPLPDKIPSLRLMKNERIY